METTDLIEALDPDGNGLIKRKELLHFFKGVINNEVGGQNASLSARGLPFECEGRVHATDFD